MKFSFDDRYRRGDKNTGESLSDPHWEDMKSAMESFRAHFQKIGIADHVELIRITSHVDVLDMLNLTAVAVFSLSKLGMNMTKEHEVWMKFHHGESRRSDAFSHFQSKIQEFLASFSGELKAAHKALRTASQLQVQTE